MNTDKNVYTIQNWITCWGLKIFLRHGDIGRMDETRCWTPAEVVELYKYNMIECMEI